MEADDSQASETILFGPFLLIAAERLLLNESRPVVLGGRALDILIALTERAGQVVSRQELIDRVWPDLIVEKANLRVHIANLRKALGDGRNGVRYITNVRGRGYCFVVAIQRGVCSRAAPAAVSARLKNAPDLPAQLSRMVGRDAIVATLSTQLTSQRFLSIVGPGGIGKTTVAVAVCHALLGEFDRAIFFADLSMISDPELVVTAVALALDCLTPGPNPLHGLLAFIAERRLLLVLDSCEHLIDSVAALTERIISESSSVHLLTTTREALRVEGEVVHLLSPLHGPRDDTRLTASAALASPAVQLFMERASASGYRSELADADAPIVAKICEQLDGIALAIELAASRVGAYGIRGVAGLLDERLPLLWQGRRNVPRHQTLQSTLDWSYDLLSDSEKRVLDRLSVFVGGFTLQAAQVVASELDREPLHVAKSIAGLVDKSLVSIAANEEQNYFRLLDTTRAYAAVKLLERGEFDEIARRHALYYAGYLETVAAGIMARLDLSAYSPEMGNIRAALDWSFSSSGDTNVGVTISVRAGPLFLGLSMLDECRHYCQRALAALNDGDRGTKQELALLEALAISLHYTRGNSGEVNAALERGLQLAETLGDQASQLRMLFGLNLSLTKLGDFRRALGVAERYATIAEKVGDPAQIVNAEWMLAVAHHISGHLAASQEHYEKGFSIAAACNLERVDYFGYNHHARALAGLARTLWLRGMPEKAFRFARQSIDIAEKDDLPVTFFICLLYVIPIFLRSGDLDNAGSLIERLVASGEKNSLSAQHAGGLALKGELMIARGQVDEGIELLRNALPTLHASQYYTLEIPAICALAAGLLRSGQAHEALELIDTAVARSEQYGPIYEAADLQRTRGEILLALPQPDANAAEHALMQSLERARRQGALTWELPSAIALAGLWQKQGRAAEALDLLAEVSQRFARGSNTADLREATRLIDLLK